jgi:hypothetical protein
VQHIVVVLSLLFFGPATSAYRGEVRLPVDLYTEAGGTIASGKYQVEVRLEAGAAKLAFLSGSDVVAAIEADAKRPDTNFTIPLAGTVLLRPVEKPKSEESSDQSRSEISPYLTPISWNTTLRFYKSSSGTQVRAIYRNGKTTIEFPLDSARPRKP